MKKSLIMLVAILTFVVGSVLAGIETTSVTLTMNADPIYEAISDVDSAAGKLADDQKWTGSNAFDEVYLKVVSVTATEVAPESYYLDFSDDDYYGVDCYVYLDTSVTLEKTYTNYVNNMPYILNRYNLLLDGGGVATYVLLSTSQEIGEGVSPQYEEQINFWPLNPVWTAPVVEANYSTNEVNLSTSLTNLLQRIETLEQ